MGKRGRKPLAAGEGSETVAMRIDAATMRKVAAFRDLNPVPVSAPAVLRWLVAKGIDAVEKEAANG